MPYEVLNQSWTKKDAHVRAPNITALSRRFNSIAQWITSSILCLQTPKLRGERISKVIDIANILVQRNNYSTLMAIIAGINKASISRLKLSLKEVPPKAIKVL
jgi:hypothetical protein